MATGGGRCVWEQAKSASVFHCGMIKEPREQLYIRGIYCFPKESGFPESAKKKLNVGLRWKHWSEGLLGGNEGGQRWAALDGQWSFIGAELVRESSLK